MTATNPVGDELDTILGNLSVEYIFGADTHVDAKVVDVTEHVDAQAEDVWRTYTDAATVEAVQRAIHALPQYATDKLLNLGNTGPNKDGVDGKFGPKTAAAVERINGYYRAGGAAANDGPYITSGTLRALKLDALVGPRPAPPVPPAQALPRAPVGTPIVAPSVPAPPAGQTGWPWWQTTLVAVLGATGLGALAYGIWHRKGS